MGTIKLRGLLQILEDLETTKFPGSEVEQFLSSHEFRGQEFAPYLYFSAHHYCRNLVVKKANYELLVLTWLPGQCAPVHDHGEQRCWTVVLSGTLKVKHFELNTAGHLEPLGPEEWHRAGDASYIDDRIGLHSITNASDEPAISLHLYSRPITRCRIYDERSNSFFWKELCNFSEYGVVMDKTSAEAQKPVEFENLKQFRLTPARKA